MFQLKTKVAAAVYSTYYFVDLWDHGADTHTHSDVRRSGDSDRSWYRQAKLTDPKPSETAALLAAASGRRSGLETTIAVFMIVNRSARGVRRVVLVCHVAHRGQGRQTQARIESHQRGTSIVVDHPTPGSMPHLRAFHPGSICTSAPSNSVRAGFPTELGERLPPGSISAIMGMQRDRRSTSA